ncbi:hypothetical protein EVAR_84949_1 [Eumeta japonica]|uniref:Uncharacterized protein n=1 Tax=Eumeta variegata TaxID=151549 RepID=A0A4C1VHW8_EUMVA|nr:hypothetical protein EVAR_84949_1 [Eumeta japonica]
MCHAGVGRRDDPLTLLQISVVTAALCARMRILHKVCRKTRTRDSVMFIVSMVESGAGLLSIFEVVRPQHRRANADVRVLLGLKLSGGGRRAAGAADRRRPADIGRPLIGLSSH